MKYSCEIDLANGQQLRFVVAGQGPSDGLRKATVAAKKFNNGNINVRMVQGNPIGVPLVRVKVTDKTKPDGTVKGRPKVVNMMTVG